MELLKLSVIISILLIVMGTMAMPPKSKKKSTRRSQHRDHSDRSPTSNKYQVYLNKDVFRYMASDNPLLATYNPDYIDDQLMQKRVLDGYIYTHEYVISSLNYLKPLINHANEFHRTFLTRWLALQKEASDAYLLRALQHDLAQELLLSSLRQPSLLIAMSFFDKSLEALLDRRLSKAHIYNVMVNLVSNLGSSLSSMESTLSLYRRVAALSAKQMNNLSPEQRQSSEFKQHHAYCQVSQLFFDSQEQLIKVLRGIELFDIDSVRQSIRKAVTALRGEGAKYPEFSQTVLLNGEYFISFLQLYQILFPIVAGNDKFVEQLRLVQKDSRRYSPYRISQQQMHQYESPQDFGKFLKKVSSQNSEQLQYSYERMTAKLDQDSQESEYMQKMAEVLGMPSILESVSIAEIISLGHGIFKEYCLKALPMIEPLLQAYRLRESDIPHEFATLPLEQSSPCLSVSNIRQSLLCQSEDGTLSNHMSELDLYNTADSGDAQLEGLPTEMDVVLDPEYRDEIDFDLNTDSEDYEIQSQDVQQAGLPGGSSHDSDNSKEVAPFRNTRKEVCAEWQNFDKYQFTRTDQLNSVERVIFSAGQIFILCQITDGATKGGYNVKYQQFQSLLSEFNAVVTPLTGSISRISVPMIGKHPLSIHGPHSGNVELGRRVIKGARRVLDYYEILPENFQPLHG
ncbi:hypothetical protein MP228_010590 [Amoeboaphelidium protococcarum]|nr:hypothetical protein MP228_010590 [Amoeboaphelidium protococcarum]